MKQPFTSKKPIDWFPILAVLVPCLWGLSLWLRDWPLATITAAMTVYLVVDAWSLFSKKKATRKDSKLSTPKGPKKRT
jgi:hypothetical protein